MEAKETNIGTCNKTFKKNIYRKNKKTDRKQKRKMPYSN